MGDTMSLVVALVKKEKLRNAFMREHYKQEIAALPRGTIVKKKVGNHDYYYIKYRSGNKTVTDYLGKNPEKIEQTRQQLQKRKHDEEMLSELNKERDMIIKMLEDEK
ncbi:hypothetical protein [Caproicibacter sp. BJN0012]|uniref:hypothetical protein n=1 Tax=Caproicibacter sp. BJN0012 TaxID=3110227 RepID=UPI002E0F79F4